MNKETLFTGGSVFGAVLASGCCVLPFVLFSLGVGGAWMSNLRALEPYSELFILLSLVFATAGLFVIRKRKNTQACASGDYCSSTGADHVRQILLWFSVGLVALALAWPKLLPLILGPIQ